MAVESHQTRALTNDESSAMIASRKWVVKVLLTGYDTTA